MEYFDFYFKAETETSILFFFNFVRLPDVRTQSCLGTIYKSKLTNRASRLSRICEMHINNENFTLPRGYEGHSPSGRDMADFKSEAS